MLNNIFIYSRFKKSKDKYKVLKMFEKIHHKLAPFHIFALRFLFNLIVGLLIIAICLYAGMWGYHHFENMNWTDSYLNAAMILSGMGPIQELKTEGGKVFAGSYALFSGIIFLFFIALVFAPIFHRFYHQFHLKDKDKTDN